MLLARGVHAHLTRGGSTLRNAPEQGLGRRCSCWCWTRAAGWRRVGPTGGDSGSSARGTLGGKFWPLTAVTLQLQRGSNEVGRQLLVLGCSQAKRETPGLLPAIDRYDGSSYRVLRNYLREREWPSKLSVAILSAKYGLVGGFTGIEDYDERMTPLRALEWAPKCMLTLSAWATDHTSIHFSLGKDYLPAVVPAIEHDLKGKAEVFEGRIGMKLSQIKGLLQRTGAPARHRPALPEPGSGRVSYFLPDWDDLLDEHFDFESDEFSGVSRQERDDKHCCILMKPKRMCDGVLVSLAQHVTSKGPLRRIMGTEASSLLTFRRASLTSYVEFIKPDAYPQSMSLLWTAVATTMLQRLKLLKDVLSLYLNRQKGMALLARVQASDLRDEDRARVSRIIRTMLKLPDAPEQEPSSPEASDPSAYAARRRQRRSS
ncbi:MAG TPA: hypothetical protein VI542_27080 [Candidatus Tectomicrobia bacterium]